MPMLGRGIPPPNRKVSTGMLTNMLRHAASWSARPPVEVETAKEFLQGSPAQNQKFFCVKYYLETRSSQNNLPPSQGLETGSFQAKHRHNTSSPETPIYEISREVHEQQNHQRLFGDFSHRSHFLLHRLQAAQASARKSGGREAYSRSRESSGDASGFFDERVL